jgi:hypothetical protein
MNTGAAGVERAEQIKWWDALDALAEECVEEGLQMTRKCLHPDAQWLASLFPAGVAVARERMREMMLELRNDRRALYVAWLLGEGDADTTRLLERSAEMDYSPVGLAVRCGGRFEMEPKSCRPNRGMWRLGHFFFFGVKGCVKDEEKGRQLTGEAGRRKRSLLLAR